MKIPFYLRSAIEEAFSPDPHLGTPDPETVEAVALLVLDMAAVSKSRKAAYADEPWKTQPAREHLEHAHVHSEAALVAVETRMHERWFDTETGLPNAAHAALRLAFGVARRGP